MTLSPALFNSIEDLVLHRSPMLFLESLQQWNDEGAEVIVNPQDSSLFANENGLIPSWVGIEYMAQAISAYSGVNAISKGLPLGMGLLLGSRRYNATVSYFEPTQKLVVKVKQIFRDETNLVLFDCHIFAKGKLLASAEIKGIEPQDSTAVFAQFEEMIAAVNEKPRGQ